MDTRLRLIQVCADLLNRSGPELSMRAVCEAAGVTAPTLYHHFGDKQGLIDATVASAFDRYLTRKENEISAEVDLIDELRQGWDLHVDFGRSNPILYTLMFPTVNPAELPSAARKAWKMLQSSMERAERKGQLTLDADTAIHALWAAQYGITRLICSGGEQLLDAERLSAIIRDAVISAITSSDLTLHE